MSEIKPTIVLEKVGDAARAVKEMATGTGRAAPIRGGGHEHQSPDAPPRATKARRT